MLMHESEVFPACRTEMRWLSRGSVHIWTILVHATVTHTRLVIGYQCNVDQWEHKWISWVDWLCIIAASPSTYPCCVSQVSIMLLTVSLCCVRDKVCCCCLSNTFFWLVQVHSNPLSLLLKQHVPGVWEHINLLVPPRRGHHQEGHIISTTPRCWFTALFWRFPDIIGQQKCSSKKKSLWW